MSRYSETIMEHFMEPRNMGRMDNPSGTGVSGAPGRGAYFVFQVKCNASFVEAARFQCHNCGVTVACGSMLTEMVLGLTGAECLEISPAAVSERLDGVPVDKMHVVEFGLQALRMAIEEAVP